MSWASLIGDILSSLLLLWLAVDSVITRKRLAKLDESTSGAHRGIVSLGYEVCAEAIRRIKNTSRLDERLSVLEKERGERIMVANPSLRLKTFPVATDRLDWTIDSQHLVLDGEHLIPWEVIDAKRKERDLYARPAQKPERKRIKADRAYIEGPDDDIADRFDGQWQGKYFLTSGPHGEGRLYEFTNPKRHFNGLPVYEWNRVTDPEVLKTHGVLT